MGINAGSLRGHKDGQIYLGVVSPRGFENTYKRYAPLAKYFSEKTGKAFKIVPLDHPNNLPYLRDGKIDFLLTNPTIAATIYKTTSARFLATLHKPSGYQFGGVIFAKKGAGITDIRDLKDKRVLTFKIRKSAGAHIFQSYHLLQQGIDGSNYFNWLRAAKTQDYVVEGVLRGHADAGFVRTGILEQLDREGKIKLSDFVILDQVLDSQYPQVHSTALYPEWFLIAGEDVEAQLMNQTKKSALAITPDMNVAKSVNIKGFVKPQPIQPLINVLTTLRIPPFDQ